MEIPIISRLEVESWIRNLFIECVFLFDYTSSVNICALLLLYSCKLKPEKETKFHSITFSILSMYWPTRRVHQKSLRRTRGKIGHWTLHSTASDLSQRCTFGWDQIWCTFGISSTETAKSLIKSKLLMDIMEKLAISKTKTKVMMVNPVKSES